MRSSADQGPGLTRFQVQVAQLFSGLRGPAARQRDILPTPDRWPARTPRRSGSGRHPRSPSNIEHHRSHAEPGRPDGGQGDALFNRAAARDFVDVFVLCERFGKELLLTWAGDADRGFDLTVFASMLDMLDRFDDESLSLDPAVDPAQVRQFCYSWAEELRS